MDALSREMEYLTEKDAVLSSNIANVDTPNYKAKTIKKRTTHDHDFNMTTTNSGHINCESDDSDFVTYDSEAVEIKPNGNSVNLNHEMAEKSKNSLKFHEISNIYQKTRSLMEAALN